MPVCRVQNNLPVPIGVGSTSFHIGATERMTLEIAEIEGLRRAGLTVEVLASEGSAPRALAHPPLEVSSNTLGLKQVLFFSPTLEFGRIDPGKAVTVRVPILVESGNLTAMANPTTYLGDGLIYSSHLEPLQVAITVSKFTPGAAESPKTVWNIMVFIADI